MNLIKSSDLYKHDDSVIQVAITQLKLAIALAKAISHTTKDVKRTNLIEVNTLINKIKDESDKK